MLSVLEVGQTGLTTVEESEGLLAPGPCAKPAPRPLLLRSNFSWTFAGNVVYAGCQWGMLVLLATFGSPQWVGSFRIGQAVRDAAVVGAVADGIVVVVHASAPRYHDAVRTRELLNNLGPPPLLGMIVNGIGGTRTAVYGYYRSNGAKAKTGRSFILSLLLATTQPMPLTNGNGKSGPA